MPDYSKPDHWSVRAQKEKFPARSVYKLEEMDKKFSLIKGTASHQKILDMGSAPGSWSLYVLRKLSSVDRLEGKETDLKKEAGIKKETGLLLVSVDLLDLSRQFDNGLFDSEEFNFIKGDFTREDIRQKITGLGPYNLIICDAAPSTSGNNSLDSLRSIALAETVLSYAENCLVKNGSLIIKIFQGSETGDFLKSMRIFFNQVKTYKPAATRSASFETYFLGLGKK